MSVQPTTWAIERERAVELFGGARPSDRDEQDIARAFGKHPTEILTEITKVSAAYDAGKIHTPWRVLHARLDRITTSHRTVDLSTDKRVHLAENWVRNAGIHCPTEAEVSNELFHATSALLAGLEHQFGAQMLALWRQERPRGEQAETDKLERAQRWRQAHERLRGLTDT